MVRWLEQNGYDVSYFTGVDAARNGGLIKNHQIYMTSGHDEYWSGPQRANVEAARDAGVNMAFFTGNEVFWKTRWENSMDGSNTSFRTMVCYKETLSFAKTDPQDPPVWTGTWRDPGFSPPADGGRPENALTGTLFMVNGPGGDNDGGLSIQVPAADGKMRFWRNTAIASLAPNATYTLPAGTLGYEWDEDIDDGARPAGAFPLSTTTYSLTTDLLLDFGATYGAGKATHHLMMYRSPSGALVFGAGTVQWSWGLDDNHDTPFPFGSPDQNMQQATVNLLADMGVQPGSLQAGLLSAAPSTDRAAPFSAITTPISGASYAIGSSITITGTATDAGGGMVAAVEVSGDGGSTWHPAAGRQNWSYTWTPSAVGIATILSRAVDDSGNIETPSSGVAIHVMEHDCLCNGYGPSAAPSTPDSGDPSPVELGVKFHADYDGYVTGIRFYKSATNTGTHVGNLWSSTGTLLASAMFAGEASSGWQQVNFSNPVAISANTTYVASYYAPAGHYAATTGYFATSGLDAPPLHFLRNGADGPNGVYAYDSQSSFPASSFISTNYWVDVVYMPATSMADAPPALVVTPGNLNLMSFLGSNSPSQAITIFNQGSSTLTWTASANASWLVLSATSGTTPETLSVSANPAGLAPGTYSGAITVTAPGATNGPQTVTVTLTVTNLLLSSTFANVDALQGWVGSPLNGSLNWIVSNQALEYNGSGNSQLFAGSSGWTDYTVSATFQLGTLLDWPGGIRGRVDPITGAGYMAWVYPALNEIILYRASAWDINQPLTVLGQSSAFFETTRFHNLSLIFEGAQIQVAYDGEVLITATDSTYPGGLVALEGLNQPIALQTVLVTSPHANTSSISISTSSLSFSANYGGGNPAPQTIQISGSGGGSLGWTASTVVPWLSVSPVSGVTPASLQVSVNSSSLGAGTYSGAVTVTSLGSVPNTRVITVELTVVTQPPVIVLSPSSMNFLFITGQAAPTAQVLAVVNGGYGSFGYTALSDSAWLLVSPASDSTPGSISTTVNVAGLATGTYRGHTTITASGVPNSPVSIPVSLQVLSGDLDERFASGANGWIISPMGLAEGWSASNGIYSYSGSGLSQSCTGNSNWSDYVLDASIKLSSLSNWPGGIRARVNPSTGAGYAVWLYPASGLAILYQVGQWDINGAILKQLAQAPLSFDSTAFHDLRVSFTGSSISVFWDGTMIMTATDASYASGFVCLDGDTQPIAYSSVTVGAVLSQPTLDPQPAMVFSALPGASSGAQTINITAGGASTAWAFTSSVPWLTAVASSALTPGVLTVSVNPAGLSEGTYSGTLTIYAPGASNSPLAIPVTLAVRAAVMSVAPSALAFFGVVGLNPPAQNIAVANLGSGNLGWTANATAAWLQLGSTSGSAPSTIAVQPSTSGLAIGRYNDAITLSSADVTNSPASVPVSVEIGNLLFSDDFSTGAGNWTVSPLGFSSGWSVANQSYTYDGEGHTQVWAGSELWDDYTLAVDFQLSSMNDYPGGLRGRVNTSSGASYGVWIYPAERSLRLYRIDQWNIDAGSALLGESGALGIDTNVHNLRLSFRGSTISVYYDSQLVITTSDSSYAQGAVALDVSDQTITFSNVSVIGF
jgi:hypothetical protein